MNGRRAIVHTVLSMVAGGMFAALPPSAAGASAASTPGASAVSTPGGSAWATVTAGTSHTCATRTDATLWCWGANLDGEVGSGGTASLYPSPVQVTAPAAWARVWAGWDITCAIDADDHGLWCWGDNYWGQLGDGTIADKRVPVRIGATGGWQRVTAGADHSCAVRGDGTLWCWGTNESGELGNGTTNHHMPGTAPLPTAPIQAGTATNWVDTAVGLSHSCGLDADGAAWCWGANGFGQLGDGTNTQRLSPVRVATDTRFTAVRAAFDATCATSVAGEQWCWGSNDAGQLGDGTTTNRNVPVRVAGGLRWTGLSMNRGYACGTTTDTRVWCWGANGSGVFGRLDIAGSPVPVPAGAGLTARIVTAGGAHACRIDTDRELACWGDNAYGQLGSGTQNSALDTLDPVQVAPATRWRTVAAGDTSTCAIDTGDRLWCWGSNGSGQLGDGTTTSRTVPTRVAGAQSSAQVSTDHGSHRCAVDTRGGLWCWGGNGSGQLGDGTTTASTTPRRVRADATWSQVVTGRDQTCAIRGDSTLWCWGRDLGQQPGTPVMIGPGAGWTQAALGGYSSDLCVVRSDGGLWCIAPGSHDLQPVDQDTGWATVSTGNAVVCATRVDGTLWCLGDNGGGQLGDGTYLSRAAMAPVAGQRSWAQVASAAYDSCATATDHTLWCWGSNERLQLGNTPQRNSNVPLQVGRRTDWAQVSAGYAFTCATRVDNTLWCWGDNAAGQLGARIPTPLVQRVLSGCAVGGGSATVAGPAVALGVGRPFRRN